jgi:hypothetical protein
MENKERHFLNCGYCGSKILENDSNCKQCGAPNNSSFLVNARRYNASNTVLQTDNLLLSSDGYATLSYYPISDISCFLDNDNVMTISSIGQDICISDYGGENVVALYERVADACGYL